MKRFFKNTTPNNNALIHIPENIYYCRRYVALNLRILPASMSMSENYVRLLSGWLKVPASQNISPIFVTLDTFHLLSRWLKDLAP